VRIRHILTALPLAAALLAVPAAAHAGTAAAPAATVIFGPCTPFQDGQYRVIGHEIYECVHTGFGYYWVRWVNTCPRAVPAAPGKTAESC
jgi:hypothetical protein